MARTITHRGPDDTGVWLDAEAGIGLAHARLAIMDPSAMGHQPMASASERFVVAFNGEIYNHFDLRSELEGQMGGVHWRGRSDTETMVACFDRWGIDRTVRKLVGMFAIAVWDRECRALTLIRDRMGEKPLYYGRVGEALVFGSEIKALRANPANQFDIDRNALASFMCLQYIPTPSTIYKGVHKLPAGTSVTVRLGDQSDPSPVAYWSFQRMALDGIRNPFAGTDEEAISELRSVLSQAILGQRLADVPLGAFLSGGIDSSLIVALMQAQAGQRVSTFTIGFEDRRFDESSHARAIAKHFGTDHTDLRVTEYEAQQVIPLLASIYDEPFADSSQIPTSLVSQLARQHVKVSLSGDGGDELFGGYTRYGWTNGLLRTPAPLRRLAADCLGALRLPQLTRTRLAKCYHRAAKLRYVLGAGSNAELYERCLSHWPRDASPVIGGSPSPTISKSWESVSAMGSAEHQMMAVDAITCLPDDLLCKVDRASMARSLETRMPFLDHRVVEFAWRLPLRMKRRRGQRKWILRQLLAQSAPLELFDRPKMGFGVPIGEWLRGQLREWAEDLLCESRLKREGYFQSAPIRAKWEAHLSGSSGLHHQLWNVLMFQSWLEFNRRGIQS